MFHHLLIVCTGNICRSPMAEALLRARVTGPGVRVESAGTAALVGEPADASAARVAGEHGLDLSAHRARQLTLPMLSASDLVLVMTRDHADWIQSRYPHLRGRVQLLGRWRETEVADPYGLAEPAYREALALIDRCVEDWIPRLS